MTTVAVSKKILDWALKRSGAPAEIKKKFSKFADWQSGTSEPTIRQLEDFAKATSTPFGYFFLNAPPIEELDLPDFRTVDDQTVQQPSPDLIETVFAMERRQTWMRDHLIKRGHEPLPFVGSAKISENPHSVAVKMWQQLGLQQVWAANQPNWSSALDELKSKIEAVGILVFTNGIVGNKTRRKLDPREFRGFVISDEHVPLIFVNGADAKAAQMFTLAHEVSHIWFGQSAVFNLRDLEPAEDKTEQACNRVAAEFLLPEQQLKSVWTSVGSQPDPFEEIARRFKVSQLVAARRALDLSLITKERFLQFYRGYLKKHAKTESSGGDFYNNQTPRVGKFFGATVVRAAREGELLYRDAYQLTDLYGKTFDTFAERLGM